MTPTEQFKAWRPEIEREIEGVERDLTEARTTKESAAAEVRRQKVAWTALNDFAASAVHRHWLRPEGQSHLEGLAGPLYARIAQAREPLKDAEVAQGTARAAAARLEIQLASLRDALDQINRALTEDSNSEDKLVFYPVPKRTPEPVDFDDITVLHNK